MSFLKNLFGGQDKKLTSNIGPNPARGLNLPFTPIPENGEKFAQQFVDAVRKNEHKELDFSVDTLGFVDEFLQRFSDQGLTVNDFAETIFVTGAYIGEVLIKNNYGNWIKQEDTKMPDGVSMMPIVVKLPNGNVVDPIAKAFKRFHYGESDSISYFYQVFTGE